MEIYYDIYIVQYIKIWVLGFVYFYFNQGKEGVDFVLGDSLLYM